MRRISLYLSSLLIFIGLPSSLLKAAHIVGGEITYECLGNDEYEFTMRIYRDCLGGGALFDGIGASVEAATITIFEGNTQYQIISLNNYEVRDIPPDLSNPCLIPPDDVCVEEGIYRFTVTLPKSSQSYTVAYQRCCRNNFITNIIDPGRSGATYFVELTPEAQQFCNSSPVFNEFPPIIICANKPFVFDHSATDKDGDQLVYEFCSPLLGGGVLGSSSATLGLGSSLGGVAPNPDAPPPYEQVAYLTPTYTAFSPLAGDPVVSIHPVTGQITGMPQIQGQFVVGICVREYRDGVLLSTVQRDFQFNVEDCDPTVFADIKEDEIIDDKEFVVIVCGADEAVIENESRIQDFIKEHRWEFDIDGTTETIYSWDAPLVFPDTGTYVGQLFLNPGLDCGDTATIYVNVFPEIVSDYEYSYDTCVAGPVSFTDQSYSGSGFLTDWQWEFGDGNSSPERNPQHLFATPGTKDIALIVRDTNNCRDTLINEIYWVPAPAEVIVEPSTFLGCEPANIFFNNLSSPIDSTYTILWDLGDGNTSSAISPTHIYEEPGIYTVTVDITSPIGCYIGDEYPNWITVRESPIAGFSFIPDRPSNLQPTVDFTDESQLAVKWDWDFSGEAISTNQNPTYTFPDTGYQEIIQIVTHENGCQDTMIQRVDVEPIIKYFLPNAFTPNNDSQNDIFHPVGFFVGMTNYTMNIWNRWGENVFQTNDPNEGWNGRKNNVGRDSPSGVYVVTVSFVGPRGQPTTLKGFATLIR